MADAISTLKRAISWSRQQYEGRASSIIISILITSGLNVGIISLVRMCDRIFFVDYRDFDLYGYDLVRRVVGLFIIKIPYLFSASSYSSIAVVFINTGIILLISL